MITTPVLKHKRHTGELPVEAAAVRLQYSNGPRMRGEVRAATGNSTCACRVQKIINLRVLPGILFQLAEYFGLTTKSGGVGYYLGNRRLTNACNGVGQFTD